MEKTHRVLIDLLRVEDKSWNVVTRWTQKRIFNSMINFLMDGFKISRGLKTEDAHQVIGIVGDEKFCTEVEEKIINVEAKKLNDIGAQLQKVLPKSLRHKIMEAKFKDESKTWTRVTTILSMMGIHITVTKEKYISE